MTTRGDEVPRADDGGRETIPMQPYPAGLMVLHQGDGDEIDETIIGRRFEHPEDCNLCPPGRCDHRAGFCLVTVAGYVPVGSCALYSLPGAGERKARPRVQRPRDATA